MTHHIQPARRGPDNGGQRRAVARRRPRRAAIAAIAMTALVALAGCATSSSPVTTAAAGGGAGSFPVKVATSSGTVTIAKRPVAIMSLSASSTEMLYAIGAGPQVKAVDQYSDYPKGTPITSLSALSPNVEAIAARKPDLVIVPQDTNGLSAKLAAFKIPVLVLSAPATVGGALAQYDQLGLATGHLAQARAETAKLRQQFAAIETSVPARSTPVTYYYELDQTYYSVTSSTFIGNLLSLLHMKSIADTASDAASSGGYPQLSAEFIVSANPSYIVLADSQCCHQGPATVAARPGWAALSAVTGGHVVVVPDDIASRWGPRIIDLLQTMLGALKKNG